MSMGVSSDLLDVCVREQRPTPLVTFRVRSAHSRMANRTQNMMRDGGLVEPVLSNSGIWDIGRLQTDADRDRVIESMSQSAGTGAFTPAAPGPRGPTLRAICTSGARCPNATVSDLGLVLLPRQPSPGQRQCQLLLQPLWISPVLDVQWVPNIANLLEVRLIASHDGDCCAERDSRDHDIGHADDTASTDQIAVDATSEARG